MEITKEDLVKISEALTINGLEPSEWALFYLVMVDLGVSSEKLKEVKELKSSGQLTDCEALSRLLQNWVDNKGERTASLDDLIAAVVANTDKFPGLAKQDFVSYLNPIRKKMGLDNDYVLSSMEIVFNSVHLIKAEIYKYLSIYDKGCLRLTSKFIWNSTLSNWRKTVSLRIDNDFVNMEEVSEIYLLQEEGDENYMLGNLIEHPFTSYKLYNETISPFRETWAEWELRFWTKCAPHITNLDLNCCYYYKFSFLPTYLWLVTKACPKIEKLYLHETDESKCHPLHDKYDKAAEEAKTGNEDEAEDDPFSYRQILKCLNGKQKHHFSETPQGIANNLKVLHLVECVCRLSTDANLFLDVAPNLKNLLIKDPLYLKGLETCSDREICKLNDIYIDIDGDSQDLTALLTYSKANPDTIKRIRAEGISLDGWPKDDEEDTPLPIFQLILQYAFALVTLEVSFQDYNGNDDIDERLWFDQLATVEFPLLKKLVIKFNEKSEMIYFDFATLRKTPNLTTLSIQYEDVDEDLQRNMEAYDYVQDSASLEANPLCLDKLEEFDFGGWMVNKEDVHMFRSWFPTLKHLTVEIGSISPHHLLLIFKDLNSLTLNYKTQFHQDILVMAKALHPEVRIFMDCPKLGKFEAVKGDKGQLNVVFKPADLNSEADLAMDIYFKRMMT